MTYQITLVWILDSLSGEGILILLLLRRWGRVSLGGRTRKSSSAKGTIINHTDINLAILSLFPFPTALEREISINVDAICHLTLVSYLNGEGCDDMLL